MKTKESARVPPQSATIKANSKVLDRIGEKLIFDEWFYEAPGWEKLAESLNFEEILLEQFKTQYICARPGDTIFLEVKIYIQ